MFRTGYQEDRHAITVETGLVCDPGDTVTQQSFKEECDINTIVRRFGLTGQLPLTQAVPLSGDFTAVSDFQSAMQMIKQAEAAFMELPGELRARFRNDPGQLIAFLEDPANREEAVKLGIVNPPPAEPAAEPAPVPAKGA